MNCKLDVDSPSYPPSDNERRQCGCEDCRRDLSRSNFARACADRRRYYEHEAVREADAAKVALRSAALTKFMWMTDYQVAAVVASARKGAHYAVLAQLWVEPLTAREG